MVHFILYNWFLIIFLVILIDLKIIYCGIGIHPWRHPCLRECTPITVPLVCYYELEIEQYFTMSKACYDCPYNRTDCSRPDCIPADGIKRMVSVVNRQLPGPSIQVCLGDTIVVDVVNSMMEGSTTIHWHGITQKTTPYMDGVPFITQCPIPPGDTFRYQFLANSVGTHFWHSHSGLQRADGIYGALIVREPKENEMYSSLYNFDLPEHVMVLEDWIHEPAISKIAGYFHGGGDNKIDSILINGKGKYAEFSKKSGRILHTPLATFNVRKGSRYRFRIINAAAFNCPFQITVESHVMILIHSDGGYFERTYVESFISYAGERWDIVLNANQPTDNYWIKFRGLVDCGEKFNSVFAGAVLHYEGAANDLPKSKLSYNTSYDTDLSEGSLNDGSHSRIMTSSRKYQNLKPVKGENLFKDTEPKPDMSLTFSSDFYPINNPMIHKPDYYGYYQVKKPERILTPQMNRMSLKMPSFPLLSQPEDIDSKTFCDTTDVQTLNNCTSSFCQCTYVIRIPLHSLVEITFVETGNIFDDANHPFHLHGHKFQVVAVGKLGNSTTVDEVKALDKSGRIFRNLRNPPVKDTIAAPVGGYAIIRFNASNPGYWLMHCHIDFHVEFGMAVIFKVGEHKDFPAKPPGFPKCGNYYYYPHNSNTV